MPCSWGQFALPLMSVSGYLFPSLSSSVLICCSDLRSNYAVCLSYHMVGWKDKRDGRCCLATLSAVLVSFWTTFWRDYMWPSPMNHLPVGCIQFAHSSVSQSVRLYICIFLFQCYSSLSSHVTWHVFLLTLQIAPRFVSFPRISMCSHCIVSRFDGIFLLVVHVPRLPFLPLVAELDLWKWVVCYRLPGKPVHWEGLEVLGRWPCLCPDSASLKA